MEKSGVAVATRYTDLKKEIYNTITTSLTTDTSDVQCVDK